MSEDTNPTLRSIRTTHPFPWSQVVFDGGHVKIFDSLGHEVSIFAITGLCVELTRHMATKPEPAA